MVRPKQQVVGADVKPVTENPQLVLFGQRNANQPVAGRMGGDAVTPVTEVEFIGQHRGRRLVARVLHGSAEPLRKFLRFGQNGVLGHGAKNNQFHRI